jgi:hypothetical protein
MIEHATEIKMRAERLVGEMLIEMKATGERDPGGRGPVESRPATQLKDRRRGRGGGGWLTSAA